nr:hypothetical protein [Patescibacteria group bacterium]
VLLLFSIGLSNNLYAASQDSGASVEVSVMGCNNNARCEVNLGENIANCPIDCTPSPRTTGSSSSSPLEFYDLKVEASHNDALISWKTRENALTTFSWGKSPDYENGSVSGVSYTKVHHIKIETLNSSTRYYFKIEGRDAQGNSKKIEDSFATQISPDLTPPSNVTNLSLTEITGRNLIKWQNPTDDDFMYVRVVRSTKNYPLDGLSGRIVYEGSGNYTYDEGIELGKKYYYTVFAYDFGGNISSGATISSKLFSPGSEQGGVISPPVSGENNPYREITLQDFTFAQHQKNVEIIENKISLQGDDLLHISLPIHKINIKPHLILLEIKFGDESQTLLIREYSEKNQYETIINLQKYPGKHPFKIYFVNEKLVALHELSGTFDVSESVQNEERIWGQNYINFVFSNPVIAVPIITLLLAIISVFILIILWINRRRKRAILIAPNEPN